MRALMRSLVFMAAAAALFSGAAQAQKPGGAAATPAPQAGGFMSRNPFLSGLMGGMIGAGLIGMLFGGGFGGGLAGAAGMLGLLLQVALIGGLGYLAYRLYRGWSANRTQAAPAGGPAYALAGNTPPRPVDAPPLARSGLSGAMGGSAAMAGAPQVAIGPDDYQAFETLLAGIQAAYSKADLAALRGFATPEMVGYFSEELSSNASQGVENKVEAVKLEQGDLSGAGLYTLDAVRTPSGWRIAKLHLDQHVLRPVTHEE